MLSLIFASVYIVCYYNNENPPVCDIISPLVTLSIGLSTMIKYDHALIAYLLCLTLTFEAATDLLIHNSSQRKCLVLFSCDQMIRQLVSSLLIAVSNHEYLVIYNLLFL